MCARISDRAGRVLTLLVPQVPVVDVDALEALVRSLWKEVSHMEDAEDIPRMSVEPAVIDLGKIECVIGYAFAACVLTAG